ncbi:hypothetical protein [Thermococcus sp.]|uniref:hypothetical protein n=1 Tax=Thermococcus sp. TaxID=35749 RepID=UPI0025F95139|nr:hypothetical protein [Thermococcus sp.]
MRIEGAWPVSVPKFLLFIRLVAIALLVSLGWTMVELGIKGYYAGLLLGALLFGLSSGWKVELSGREATLVYGFGILKARTGEIIEISDLGNLRFGRLLEHLYGELMAPPFFLLLSVALFGVRGFLVLPFVIYWLVLFFVLLAFPLELLKERAGRLMVLAVFLPWALSMPLSFMGVEFQWFGLSLSTSLFGFWFLVGFVSRDYVLLRGELGEFLVACSNAGRIITALAGEENGP